MPQSLRSRVKKLAYKGIISKEDSERIRDALLIQQEKQPMSKESLLDKIKRLLVDVLRK